MFRRDGQTKVYRRRPEDVMPQNASVMEEPTQIEHVSRRRRCAEPGLRDPQSLESCGRSRFPSAYQRPGWNALVNSDEHLTRQVYHAQSRFGFRWIPHADSRQPCAAGLELAGFRVQLRDVLAYRNDCRRTRLRIPVNAPLVFLLSRCRPYDRNATFRRFRSTCETSQ